MPEGFGLPRIDLSPIHLPREALIESKKKISGYRRVGKQAAKPSECALCKSPNPVFCNSHSIPQFCLREIASNGEVKTLNSFIGIDLLDCKIGVNNAGTFRMVCRECDNVFFSDYEKPLQYENASEIGQKLLGEIVVKICLLEQYKAREQIAFMDRAYKANPIVDRISNSTGVRQLDLDDDAIQLNYAIKTVNGEGDGYRVLFDELLEYTVPLAFQGQVVLQADFQGKMVNDIFNYNPEYHTEPLIVCVFPLNGKTRVLLFCREIGYARYSRFHRGLRSKSKKRSLLGNSQNNIRVF